jgi:hypothetical protein
MWKNVIYAMKANMKEGLPLRLVNSHSNYSHWPWWTWWSALRVFRYLLECKNIRALAHVTFSKVICTLLCAALWAAHQLAFVAIYTSLRVRWVARRLAFVARCSSNQVACLSRARWFWQTCKSSKGVSSSSSFISLMRVVVLKGGDRWKGRFHGKGNQGNVFMKGVLTLTPLPQGRRPNT